MYSIDRCQSASVAIKILQMLTRTLSSWRRMLPLTGRALSSYPSHTKLTMPALSPTMTEGNLASWHIKEGDAFAPGDALAQIETDKATLDFETVDEGFLAKILIQGGTNGIAVNTPIAIVVEEKEDVAAFADYVEKDNQAAADVTSETEPVKVEPTQPPITTKQDISVAQASKAETSSRVAASPLARKTAREMEVDIVNVHGTGYGGRITATDVNDYQKSAPATAGQSVAAPVSAVPGSYEDIPHTAMRKVIAERLLQSKQTIPHYYLTVEINADNIMALRASFNKKLESSGQKLSVNDFIVKAAAAALKSNPEVNSSWHDTFIRRYNYVDICVAVSTPTGLITPIIQDADLKGLTKISEDVKDLAARARENRLLPHEYQGGTFTISNLGMFGVNEFSAIINPPQSAILAVGSASKKVVPDGKFNYNCGNNICSGEDGNFKVVNTFSVTMSCDHRVVDGAVGAQWLKSLKNYCEDPMTMLL